MKILLFGGAFDPPTFGHIEILEKVFYHEVNKSNALWDEAWTIPSYGNTFGKKMSSFEDRFAMCMNSSLNNFPLKLNAIELLYKIQGKTISVVEKLVKTLPDYKFTMLIGMDQAVLFHKWDSYERLKSLINFVVVPRKGFTCTSSPWFMEEPHMVLNINTEFEGLSSTVVREKIKKGEPIKDFVEKGVERLINERRLYVI